MQRRPALTDRPALLALLLLAVVWTFTACGDDSGGPSISTNNASTSTNNNGTTATNASTTGTSTNGTTTGTNNGTTTACTEGDVGCACGEDDACITDAICRDGTCEACPIGDDTCLCFRNDTCNDGLLCLEGVCAPCPLGQETCGCDAGACEDGLACVEDLCVPESCENTPGQEDCPCDEDNTCDDGLVCTDGGMCAPCSPDFVDCPCDEEGECGEDLVCDEDEELCREPVACEDADCVPNQQCDDSEPGQDAACLEACLPGFEWNIATGQCDRVILANCQPDAEGSILADCQTQSRQCTETPEGASCGACLPGFTDDGNEAAACRAVVTCAALGCAAQNRLCTEATDTTDAQCGACADGFVDDNGTCVVPVIANCLPDTPGSILADCDAQNRLCIAEDDDASCGDCQPGFVLQDGQCIPQVLCADLECAALGRECVGEPLAACGECLPGTATTDINDPLSPCEELPTCADFECEDGTFCVDNDITGATCSEWPCTDVNGDPRFDQAFNPTEGECVDCSILCGDAGETGDLWPFTLETGRCICETLPGFYADTSGAVVARSCDADQDGWVRDSARSAIESDDPALSTNARCDLREVDRFVLRNEYQQEQAVLVCVEGLVNQTACSTSADCAQGRCFGIEGVCGPDEVGCTCGCVESDPVALYESVRNDDQNQLDIALDADVPNYGAPGRKLQVAELNGLTRACVSESADFNDNELADVNEWHGMPLGDVSTEEAIFAKFSYFVELHQAWYARDPGAEFGRYVIAERSRCDTNFPVRYEPLIDGDYWRQCTRNRDTAYDSLSGDPMIGFDFAQYACPNAAGTCLLSDPIAEPAAPDEIAPHGLCEVTLPPADGVWRGMNHHSQFKCAVIDDLPPAEPNLNPQILTVDQLTSTAGDTLYQFNRCEATSTQLPLVWPGADTLNPSSPDVVCAPDGRGSVNGDDVGFVSVRFNTLAYERGCINEWNNWPDLCPGYTENPEAIAGAGHEADFGRLLCGCTFNFGGPECDQGCPGALLSYGGDRGDDEGTCANGYCAVTAESDGRSGFWMCADFASSAFDPAQPPGFSGEGYAIDGQITTSGFSSDALCQDGDCATGWSVQ